MKKSKCAICGARKQKATEAFDKALRMNPDYGPALTNRKLVSLLEDGESLSVLDLDCGEVDYYKDEVFGTNERQNQEPVGE